MRKKTKAAIVAVAAAAPLALATGTADSHGYISTPPSRAAFCAMGTVTNCGQIQYEPQSVEGPKGFPAAGPADGTICAGGNSRFAELDNPRGGAWPTTHLTAGAGYDFKWTLTAAHATTSFRYFITKAGWDPTKPLTRAALESQPFLTVNYGGKAPPYTVINHGTIPTGHSGHQLILGVWDIADTGNAFYSCADVQL
jgi:predicted carbohydrate-binding protein with CBM5 and CBM33 domain